MLGALRTATCIALLYPIADTQATSVFRCEDADGHVTFTLHGCSTEQNQRTQRARNLTPGSGQAIPLAKPGAGTQPDRPDALTVVGQADDGCGNRVTGAERRQAIIRQEVRSGMPRADVESSLGKPHRISRQNGLERYHYRDNRGNTRQVSFDEAGCVRGK